MYKTVTIEKDGKTYTASYYLSGDELTVNLPDENQRTTFLNGLKAEPAARMHLAAYVNTVKNK